MERKKPEDVVPQPFGKLFASYDYFNELQSTMLDDLLNTDKSLVLSAPTGSGKTVAFELAIVRMLQKTKSQQDQHNYNNILPKAVYIAPIKALCNEKFTDWKARFQSIGVTCTQLTGDTESSNLAATRLAQVVISTPEKWDSLTRRWRDFEKLLPAVQLFIVDEVHLLNEDKRGPILEAVVARMKSSGVQRFVLASATIPNAADLTSWLRGGDASLQVVQHVFSAMQRPVPLEKHVIGFNSKQRGFQFDMRLNYQLPNILRKYAENKASLIFCSSRKSAEMAAFNLNKSSSVIILSENQKLYLSQLAPSIADVKLRKLVENGIAYHHAGLQYTDRGLIESSFRQGFLMVLISTSTLAMGINLPAHLVVIKSTETYSSGGYAEYPENMLLQMIGRAGRPQYDTKGVAVILTQQKNVQKYQKLLNGTAPIESHLHKHLTEHLNSEIALNTITSLEMAMVWMRSTYLYIRAVRNPKHYGFDAKLTKDFVEHKLEELCLRQINALQGAGLVKFDAFAGTVVKTTIYGQLMTKFYLCFETMKLFQQLHGKESLEDLLKLLVQSKEMSEFMLRVNEKKLLNELNKTAVRFPIKGRIKSTEEKTSCILQAVLGNIEISATGLIQESLKIMRIGDRLSKCLLEYVRLRITEARDVDNKPNNWYSAMLNAVILAKCLHVKLWENSKFAAKQIHGIGTVYSKMLAKNGRTNLKLIARTEARTIEKLLDKTAPFGDEVLRHLMSFPEYELKLERKNDCFAFIHIKQLNEGYVHKGGATAVLILGDTLNNLLLMEENLNDIISEYGYFERLIKLEQINKVEQVYAHVIHVNLVGVDAHATLEINSPKKANKTGAVGEGKLKPKRKQSLLNFSLNDSLFDKTTLSDDSLNFDNILGNGFENISKLQYDNTKFVDDIVQVGADENNKNDTLEDSFKLDETMSSLENFRFKKPSMKNSISNMTFDETFNTTSSTNELNKTNKNDRVKQCKLTDFFRKCKRADEQVKNNVKTIDLTASPKNFDMSSKNTLKRKNVALEEEHQWSKQTPIPQKTQLLNLNKTKDNSKDGSSSIYSSSEDIPLTVIPHPNITKLSNTTLSDSIENIVSPKQKVNQCATKRYPLTLASFLYDPDELNKNESFIKLSDGQLRKTNTKRSSFFDNSNEFKRTEHVPVNLIKPMQRLLPTNERQCNQNDLLTKNHLTKTHSDCANSHPLEIGLPKCNNFELLPYKKRQTYFGLIDLSPDVAKHQNCFNGMKPVNNDNDFSLLSRPNWPAFKITAKYEPYKASKRLSDSTKSGNSFRKLFRVESQNDSPKTQYSPLDLSKTANLKKKHKLQEKYSKLKENKTTQTNFPVKLMENRNEIPTVNDFKLWHKVALQFSKVSLVEAQSLTNFQTVYNKVRQQQNQQYTTINSHNETSKTSKEATNMASKTLPSNKFDESYGNSSNLKVKQHSTFRLQLFDDKNQAKEGTKLNRHEVKLINQNVMSLVLEKKCEENCKQPEGQTQSHQKWNAELDNLERELGIGDTNGVDWNVEPLF